MRRCCGNWRRRRCLGQMELKGSKQLLKIALGRGSPETGMEIDGRRAKTMHIFPQSYRLHVRPPIRKISKILDVGEEFHAVCHGRSEERRVGKSVGRGDGEWNE